MSDKSEGLSRASSKETNNQNDKSAKSGNTATKHIKLGRQTRRNATKGGGINRSVSG